MPNSDEVIAILAGTIDGLYGTCGTVYLLGSGNGGGVRGVDYMLTKVRGQLTSFSDSNCILGNYIDEKCNKVLDTAKAYAHVLRSYIDFLNVELAKYIGVGAVQSYKLQTWQS